MKKILMVLHGSDFPEGSFNFISDLNGKSTVLLTALTIPQIVPIENWAAYSAATIGTLHDTSVETNIKLLHKKCLDNHISYTIQQGSTQPGLPQIVKETRFADLLIASDKTFYEEDGYTVAQSLRYVLQNAECPVLVVPDNMRVPEQLMFAYDGSESSMFAIKQFSYLFPELKNLNAVLVHMSKDGVDIPYKDHIERWLKGYFPRCSLVTVNYDAAQYFGAEANPYPTLIVTGSFGRTPLSQWFHPSFADKLISEYKLLLFSDHKN